MRTQPGWLSLLVGLASMLSSTAAPTYSDTSTATLTVSSITPESMVTGFTKTFDATFDLHYTRRSTAAWGVDPADLAQHDAAVAQLETIDLSDVAFHMSFMGLDAATGGTSGIESACLGLQLNDVAPAASYQVAVFAASSMDGTTFSYPTSGAVLRSTVTVAGTPSSSRVSSTANILGQDFTYLDDTVTITGVTVTFVDTVLPVTSATSHARACVGLGDVAAQLAAAGSYNLPSAVVSALQLSRTVVPTSTFDGGFWHLSTISASPGDRDRAVASVSKQFSYLGYGFEFDSGTDPRMPGGVRVTWKALASVYNDRGSSLGLDDTQYMNCDSLRDITAGFSQSQVTSGNTLVTFLNSDDAHADINSASAMYPEVTFIAVPCVQYGSEPWRLYASTQTRVAISWVSDVRVVSFADAAVMGANYPGGQDGVLVTHRRKTFVVEGRNLVAGSDRFLLARKSEVSQNADCLTATIANEIGSAGDTTMLPDALPPPGGSFVSHGGSTTLLTDVKLGSSFYSLSDTDDYTLCYKHDLEQPRAYMTHRWLSRALTGQAVNVGDPAAAVVGAPKQVSLVGQGIAVGDRFLFVRPQLLHDYGGDCNALVIASDPDNVDPTLGNHGSSVQLAGSAVSPADQAAQKVGRGDEFVVHGGSSIVAVTSVTGPNGAWRTGSSPLEWSFEEDGFVGSVGGAVPAEHKWAACYQFGDEPFVHISLLSYFVYALRRLGQPVGAGESRAVVQDRSKSFTFTATGLQAGHRLKFVTDEDLFGVGPAATLATALNTDDGIYAGAVLDETVHPACGTAPQRLYSTDGTLDVAGRVLTGQELSTLALSLSLSVRSALGVRQSDVAVDSGDSFETIPHFSGGLLRACVQFAGEPWRLFPGVVMESKGLTTPTGGFEGQPGSAFVAVLGIPKDFRVTGVGIRTGDEFKFLDPNNLRTPAGVSISKSLNDMVESDCGRHPGAGSPFGPHTLEDSEVSWSEPYRRGGTVVPGTDPALNHESSTAMPITFRTAIPGTPDLTQSNLVSSFLPLCYRFGAEGYRLYKDYGITTRTVARVQAVGVSSGIGSSLVVGVNKRIQFVGVGLQAGDQVRLAYATATTTADCQDNAHRVPWQSTTLQGDGSAQLTADGQATVRLEFASIAPMFDTGNLTAASAFDTPVPPFKLCFKHAGEPEYTLYSSIEFTPRLVLDLTTLTGSETAAVVNQPKVFRIHGPGVRDGDQMKWVPGIVKQADECADASLAIYRAATVVSHANGVTLYADGTSDGGRDPSNGIMTAGGLPGDAVYGREAVVTTIKASTRFRPFKLCYKFSNEGGDGKAEPWVLYTSQEFAEFRNYQLESKMLYALSTAVAVQGATRRVDILAMHSSERDRAKWIPADVLRNVPSGVNPCDLVDDKAAASGSVSVAAVVSSNQEATSQIPAVYMATTTPERADALRMSFLFTQLGRDHRLCFQFGGEPYALYEEFRMRIVSPTIRSASSASAVVGTSKVYTITGAIGMTLTDRLRWINSKRGSCTDSSGALRPPAGGISELVLEEVLNSAATAQQVMSKPGTVHDRSTIQPSQQLFPSDFVDDPALTASTDVSIKFTESSVGSSVWRLCYQFGDSDYEYFGSIVMQAKQIQSIQLSEAFTFVSTPLSATKVSQNIGAGVALVGEPSGFVFDGPGVSSDDFAAWAAPGSTSSAACPAVSAAFLQTKNTTGFVSYAGSQVQAIRRRRADFSFNAETSGLVLCYLFAGETAFAIFPNVKVTVMGVGLPTPAISNQALIGRISIVTDYEALLPLNGPVHLQYKATFAADIARALDIPAARVSVTQVRPGSVITWFKIAPSAMPTDIQAHQLGPKLQALFDDVPVEGGPRNPLYRGELTRKIALDVPLQWSVEADTVDTRFDSLEPVGGPFLTTVENLERALTISVRTLSYRSEGVVSFQPADYRGVEGSRINVTMVRDQGANNYVTVIAQSLDGTATAGEDYIAIDQRVQFKPNQRVAWFEVELLRDNEVEAHLESFTITLTMVGAGMVQALGSVATAVVRIFDEVPVPAGLMPSWYRALHPSLPYLEAIVSPVHDNATLRLRAATTFHRTNGSAVTAFMPDADHTTMSGLKQRKHSLDNDTFTSTWGDNLVPSDDFRVSSPEEGVFTACVELEDDQTCVDSNGTVSNAFGGWQIVGNGAYGRLQQDVHGTYGVDERFDRDDYNQRCDYASSPEPCDYACETGKLAGDLNYGYGVGALLLNGSGEIHTRDPVEDFPTTEFTVSLWVRIGDGSIPHLGEALASDPYLRSDYSKMVIFSYSRHVPADEKIWSADGSVGSDAVGLMLWNPTNLRLVINDRVVGTRRGLQTRVNIADGEWHHLIVSWRAADGKVAIYDNAETVFTSSAYKTGQSLPESGVLVVGQHQRRTGCDPDDPNPTTGSDVSCRWRGTMVDRSALLGRVQNIRVWSYLFTPEDAAEEVVWPFVRSEVGLIAYYRFEPDLLLDGPPGHLYEVVDIGFGGQNHPMVSSSMDVAFVSDPSNENTPSLREDFPCGDVHSDVWYFSAPESYLGDQLRAYNGRLQFDLKLTSFNGQARVGRASIVLHGAAPGGGSDEQIVLSYPLDGFQSLTNGDWVRFAAVFREDFGWIREPTGVAATVDELRQVLLNVAGLYIRGDLYQHSTSGSGAEVVYINNVVLVGASVGSG